MLTLTDEELRKVQLTELELLIAVDRICKKHGIKYCIIAGTLLGAVRHGGFIPWDDDADIAMLREEYVKFRDVCASEERDSLYYFQDEAVTPGYRWGYGKFRRKDTVFRREHQEHMPYEQGISIDIFPMDGIPDSMLGRTVTDINCFFLRKLLWSEAGRIAEKSAVKRVFYTLVSKIPEENVKNAYRRLVRRSEALGSSRYVRILMFPTGMKERGYLRRWYSDTAPVEFEGYVFEGIRNSHEYLSEKFGNYMEYPPVSERIKKQHPVTALKFAGEEIREEKRI